MPPTSADPLFEIQLAKGELFTAPVRVVEMEVSKCHANVARLWRDGVLVSIGTGYTLAEDGLWREHTWGIDADSSLIETTLMFDKYFGFELSGRRRRICQLGGSVEHRNT